MPNAVTKSDLLPLLPKLSADDLKAVIAIAQTLLQARTGALAEGATGAGQPIFDALVTALGRATPYNKLTQKVRGEFDRKSAELATVLDRDFPGWSANRVLQTAFLRMMLDMLKDNLKQIGVNPTLTTMVTHLHRVPVVFDREFPGYRENKLGELILKRLQKR